ncbi:MAG TPA: bifunctional DNA-formamidopyrimidine glycosylase/DNA-(apurinic or apyrimidinic site) lyase [Patescibacteria group bacterium]|jgi:formamidopyrimidine-DNA glycosylase|nr:bifunctional DNA-formamidopyrimidine glycosylase/DNA-(apurinic or apyrimidinic site) lyase [Patescibacteria group bacterium]
MPELPEVETIKNGLGILLPGKIIKSIESDWPKGFPNLETDIEQFLVGAKIVKVTRRAKMLIITLDTGYSLVFHLKMTGQLVFRGKKHFGAGHPGDSLIGPLPDKSTRVIITFKQDQEKLFFNDQRKFGWVRLIPTAEIDKVDFIQKLGPEPLSTSFTAEQLAGRLRRRAHSSIKAALLDQTMLAGVGNIYADESLWAARIHPATLVSKLSQRKIYQLFCDIQNVLRLAIKEGGSTDRNYVDAQGYGGGYLNVAKVFRKENTPCPRCGSTIIKIRVAGRGTHLCPKCQKEIK